MDKKDVICICINMYVYMYTHIHTMECYSAIKYEIIPFAATRMDLEVTVHSEIRERQVSYITYMWKLK